MRIHHLLAISLTFTILSSHSAQAASCPQAGHWWLPDQQRNANPQQVITQAAQRRMVLLGEHHDNEDHHRWQLQTLAQLLGQERSMVIGFEMFPRHSQPALDQWVAGEFQDEQAFLDAVEWDRIWGFDPALYLPLFHFARLNKIPMLALNVKRTIVRQVAQEGWDSLSPAQKDGLKKPYPATERYKARLKEVFAHHGGDADAPENQTRFANFVAAQQTWDASMAQTLAHAYHAKDRPLVVGIMGSGHIDHGDGVPHQLAQMDIPSTSLRPYSTEETCPQIDPTLADAVFIVEGGKNH